MYSIVISIQKFNLDVEKKKNKFIYKQYATINTFCFFSSSGRVRFLLVFTLDYNKNGFKF